MTTLHKWRKTHFKALYLLAADGTKKKTALE